MDRRFHKKLISKIYTNYENKLPETIKKELKAIVEDSIDRHGPIIVFFRADDIGPPSKNYTQMMQLFIKYQVPICLAVVPVWMTTPRWEAMTGFTEQRPELFCWHMHGYRHKNYETEGKKQEFGPARSDKDLFKDLSGGWARLQSIMGNCLTPVFTPPWNRCTLRTMLELQKVGFKGISRSVGSKILPQEGFEDFPVHVDLHTRKEKDANVGWKNLMNEFKSYLPLGVCGIMLHHMRMNEAAFIFLEYLLKLLSGYEQIRIVTYKDLI